MKERKKERKKKRNEMKERKKRIPDRRICIETLHQMEQKSQKDFCSDLQSNNFCDDWGRGRCYKHFWNPKS